MACPPPADHGQILTKVGRFLGFRSSGSSIGIQPPPRTLVRDLVMNRDSYDLHGLDVVVMDRARYVGRRSK